MSITRNFGDEVSMGISVEQVTYDTTGKEIARKNMKLTDYNVSAMQLAEGVFTTLPDTVVVVDPDKENSINLTMSGSTSSEHISMQATITYRIILQHKTVPGKRHTLHKEQLIRV